MGKLKKLKKRPISKFPESLPNTSILPSFIKDYLDHYFDNYLANMTLMLHAEQIKYETEVPKARELMEIETMRDKEEVIDRVILEAINVLHLPLIPKLIAD